VGRAQVFGTRFRKELSISTVRHDGSIVVVDLLSEGSYTIIGREVIDVTWQYKFDTCDMTPALINAEPIIHRGECQRNQSPGVTSPSSISQPLRHLLEPALGIPFADWRRAAAKKAIRGCDLPHGISAGNWLQFKDE
jgi:hypothetical protein